MTGKQHKTTWILVAAIAVITTGCGRVSATQSRLGTSAVGAASTNATPGSLGKVNLTSGGNGALHGRVLDAAGRPVAGAVVQIGATGQRVTTDGTGTYKTVVPEGNYEFKAMASGLTQSTPAGVLVEAAIDTAVPDITMVPGSGPSGITSITYTQEGAFAFEGSAPATLIAPLGLAVHGGTTLVLDPNKSALVHTGVVRQYGQDGKFQGKFGDYTHWLGFKIMSDNVTAIAVDQQGRTLVLDDAKKLWRFTTDGDKDKDIDVAVDGTDDMCVDPTSGAIYIAGGGITKLNAEGESPQKLSAAGNVSAIAAAKDALWGVVDNKVQKMGLDGTMQIEFGASGIDHPDTYQEAVDVAVDPRNGDVVVVDKGTKQVYVYDTAGVLIGKVGQGVFDAPKAAVVDKDGRVYVLDAGKKKVYKFLPTLMK